MSDFFKYFKENMDGLGLPAPESLFGSLQLAVSNVSIFLAHIDKFGRGITVRELVGAGLRLEQLGMVAALSASYYVGAVIGSLAVATGRSIAGGRSIAAVILCARQNNIHGPWLARTLSRIPGIHKPGVPVPKSLTKAGAAR